MWQFDELLTKTKLMNIPVSLSSIDNRKKLADLVISQLYYHLLEGNVAKMTVWFSRVDLVIYFHAILQKRPFFQLFLTKTGLK